MQFKDEDKSADDEPYYQNMVCSLTYAGSKSNQKASYVTSCGSELLDELTFEARAANIIGSDKNCKSPWLQTASLTGFITDFRRIDENSDGRLAVCSYYRYFEARGVPELKVGEDLNFVAGFNHFTNTKEAGATSFGHSKKLTWVIQDQATLTLAVASNLVFGSVILTALL